VWLMVRFPGPGLPIGHAGTRVRAQPCGHAAARWQPSGEPGCGKNAGNVQAGGGKPSACLGKRPPTASRYMAAYGPDRRPSLLGEGKAPEAARHIVTVGREVNRARTSSRRGPRRRSAGAASIRTSRQIPPQSTQRSVSPLPRRSAEDIAVILAGRHWTSAAGRLARPLTAVDCGARGRQTGGMGAAGFPGHARGSGVARRPNSPKGRHDGHRQEPCFCYTPGAARSAPSPPPGPVCGAAGRAR
jgi:hypothetical protein